MGAWGNNVLENDDALDLIDDLISDESKLIKVLSSILDSYNLYDIKKKNGEHITVLSERQKLKLVDELNNYPWEDSDGNSGTTLTGDLMTTIDEIDDVQIDEGISKACSAIASSYIILYHLVPEKLKKGNFPIDKNYKPDKETLDKVYSVLNKILDNDLIVAPDVVDKKFHKNIKELITIVKTLI